MRPDLLARISAVNKPFKIFTDVVEDGAMTQFAECMELSSVIQGALMPDTHQGYVAPIGSVLLTHNTIFPSFVGYDIGCGMSECKLDVNVEDITHEQLIAIKNQILKDVPIGFSRHKETQPMPATLFTMPQTGFANGVIIDTGVLQIGTLGGGNHFLELGKCNDGKLSIVVHSGSRGVGHKIATHYMREAAIANTDEQRYINEFDNKSKEWLRAAKNADGAVRSQTALFAYEKARREFVYRRVRARVDNIEDAYPLDVNSQLGKDYINDMNMCLEFALANRKTMIDKCIYAVEQVLDTKPNELRFINRNHNHAEHVRSNEWVHRKGATHAEDGMLGVIPGNMVDGSFIVTGLGNANSMSSSSHGAGRILSRKKAKDSLSTTDFRESTKHLVANHSDSNVDESPKAYKDIFEVMENQKDLVEVIDRVIPIINIKG